MYELPEDIEDTFLDNEVVQMIAFNVSQIYIYFESGTQIIVEGKYLLSENGNEQLYQVFPLSSDHGLLGLLEKKILYTKISNKRQDLIVFFSNGVLLKLIGDPHYESYSLKVRNRTIIV